MGSTSTILLCFAALTLAAALAAIGTHYVGTELVERSVPGSVMGPEYNPPPPYIPVS